MVPNRLELFAGEEDWKREDAVEFCLGEAPASYVVFSALGETIIAFTAGSLHAFDRTVCEDFDLQFDADADLFGGVFARAVVPAHFLDVLVVGVDDRGHVGGGELELTAVGLRKLGHVSVRIGGGGWWCGGCGWIRGGGACAGGCWLAGWGGWVRCGHGSRATDEEDGGEPKNSNVHGDVLSIPRVRQGERTANTRQIVCDHGAKARPAIGRATGAGDGLLSNAHVVWLGATRIEDTSSAAPYVGWCCGVRLGRGFVSTDVLGRRAFKSERGQA